MRSVAPGSGVMRMPPVSVCHQVSTIGQRPSPTTWIIPLPRFRVDRLADAAEQAQRRAARALHEGVARAHERADRRWRGVEDVHLPLVDDLPEARHRRVVRHSLEHQRRRAVGERPVEDIAVPGDPADVGGAPVDVAVVIVEHVLVRDGGEHEIAAGGVHDALRTSRRARGVEDEQRVLRRHLDRRAICRHLRQLIVQPEVAARRPTARDCRCGVRPAPSRRPWRPSSTLRPRSS